MTQGFRVTGMLREGADYPPLRCCEKGIKSTLFMVMRLFQAAW